MANAVVVMNRPGVKAMLHDPRVEAYLHRLAQQSASSYVPPEGVSSPSIRTDVSHEAGGWGRAIARVVVGYENAPYRESQSGRLAAALDAG